MHIHTVHIPLMLLYSWSPFSARSLITKACQQLRAPLQQLALQVFFLHLGEVKWRSRCSIANKHYIANLFPLVKVLLRRSFYLLVYTHSSIKMRCKLGNLADWHFCLGEKSMDSKMKISFAHNALAWVLRWQVGASKSPDVSNNTAKHLVIHVPACDSGR